MLYVVRNTDILQNCLNHLRSLPTHKFWDVSIEEHKAKRSTQQNRYYWSCLNILGKDNGDSPDDLHEFFKMDLLGLREIEYRGKTVTVPKSTTKLSTKEFAVYMNEIIGQAFSIGVTLPTPEHFGYDWKLNPIGAR
jgi:hypothetical protein